MWIKILKYAAQAALAFGLDKKLKSWVKGKLEKAENKIDKKLDEAWDKVEEMRDE